MPIIKLVNLHKSFGKKHVLKGINLKIEEKKKLSENTDTLRREHNAIVRAYNHTLDGFIGKRLAQKLKYEKKEIIEKI